MTDSMAIVPAAGREIIRTMDDAERAARSMAASGYFTDARELSQALVKILAGREMGFGPFAAMNGVYIIQGRPSVGANLMGAAVKASNKYDYRILTLTADTCELAFYQHGEEIGRSKFTLADARAAGTKNLDKFPRNMLFARAMSNGVRWYCPDVFLGNTVYTPEELGAQVNEQGEVIDLPAGEPDRKMIEPQLEQKSANGSAKKDRGEQVATIAGAPVYAGDPAPKALLTRYQELCGTARAYKIDPVGLTATVTAGELIGTANALKALIAEAEKEAGNGTTA